MATFIISFAILVLYSLATYLVLRKTKMEAVKQYSATIVLVAFLLSFISRTVSNALRLILIEVAEKSTKDSLDTILTVLIFVIKVSVSAKCLVIFRFIFELLALRVKLDAGQVSDY